MEEEVARFYSKHVSFPPVPSFSLHPQSDVNITARNLPGSIPGWIIGGELSSLRECLINTAMPPNNLQASGLKVARWKGLVGPGRGTLRYPPRGQRKGMDGAEKRGTQILPSAILRRFYFSLPTPTPLTDSLATAALG